MIIMQYLKYTLINYLIKLLESQFIYEYPKSIWGKTLIAFRAIFFELVRDPNYCVLGGGKA